MNKLIIIITIVLLFGITGFAQTDTMEVDSSMNAPVMEPMSTSSFDHDFIIPKITPLAPESAQLGRFGQYEVSYFNGLVNIEIPIHVVTVNDIEVPVTLKYHPSGVKVTDRAGLVGLGWALQAGGYISRQVMSKPDEFPEGYLNDITIQNSINTSTEAGLQYLHWVYTGVIDTEPDIFSYSFGNMFGKFLFNQQDNYKKVMIPYNPVKITHTVSGNTLQFEAYDKNGIMYMFSDYEASSNSNDNFSVRSSWKISNIKSANKRDSVTFNYTSTSGTTYNDVNDMIIVDDLVFNGTSSTYSSNTGNNSSISQSIFSTEQILNIIEYPLGKVEFSLIADRQDGYQSQKRLDAINIYSKNPKTGTYALLKTLTLYQDYFQGSNDKRLRLDSLHIKDASGTIIQRYAFEYNLDNDLPDFNSKKRDYWGYYNGKSNNTLIPRQTIQWQSNGNTEPTTIIIGSIIPNGREPSSTYMKAGILKKIVYPTGGWTEFEYETNQYIDETQNPKLAGGLRIAKIRNYTDASSSPIVKTIKYGLNESGYGRPNFIMNNYSFVSEVTNKYHFDCAAYATKRTRTYVSNPSVSIEPYDGSPVVYANVTVYEGDETSNSGKTNYEYSDYADHLSSLFAIGVPAIESNHFKRGQLLKKTTFKIDGAQPVKVKEKINIYGAYSDSIKSKIGLKVKRLIVLESSGGAGAFSGMPDICGVTDQYALFYNYYVVKTGDSKLTSTTVKNFSSDGLDSISQSTSYNYDNFLHQQVTKTVTSTSDNKTLEKYIEYPHEKMGNNVYTDMVNNHIIAVPVKEEIKLNGSTLSVLKRDYYSPFLNIFEPDSITKQYGINPEFTEIDITKYDNNGNILEFIPRTGVKKAIFWGYGNQYPVSEIENTSYSDIVSQLGTLLGQLDNYTDMSNSSDRGNLQVLNSSIRANAPAKTLITTYTYKPLIGITSKTDPAGRTTYYEYDSFGRLKLVRDQNQNIISKNEYHYANE